MSEEQIKKDAQFIAGIYNYCDRWCEKCSLWDKCSFFASLIKNKQSPENEQFNENFWTEFQIVLNQALGILTKIVREHDLSLSSENIENILAKGFDESTETNPPLLRLALHYATSVDDWVRSAETLFAEKENEIDDILMLGVDSESTTEEYQRVTNAKKIIRWYQHQIHAKLKQALFKENEPAPSQNVIRNFDGIAKVALMGMDRSIAAWIQLCDIFKAKTDDILTILLQLDRLRKLTEQEFPHAREFKRPGFDE